MSAGTRIAFAVLVSTSSGASQTEGDLRNQTFVPTVDLSTREALSAVRDAIDRGQSAAEIRALSEAFLRSGSKGLLVPVDARVSLSKRRALLQTWIERSSDRRDLLGRVPPNLDAVVTATDDEMWSRVAQAATDHPGSRRAFLTLRALGDAFLEAGRTLEAAVLYRRAATHALGHSEGASFRASLAVRRLLAATRLEDPVALAEQVGSLPSDAKTPLAGETLDRTALRDRYAGEVPGPRDVNARLVLHWNEPLDEDLDHVPLSRYGIRREDPPYGETDLQPAFLGPWILVQDRLRVYRFEAATGRRIEVQALEPLLATAHGGRFVAPAPYRGWVRRRPIGSAGHVVLVHGDTQHAAERTCVAALRVPAGPNGALSLAWSRLGASGIRVENGERTRFVDEGIETFDRVFCPFPTRVQDRVYVVSRSAVELSQRVELWCLDVASGALRFHVELCEGSPVLGDAGLGRLRTGGPLPLSPPLYHDGTLWVGTPLGVTFAIDPLDGEVLLAIRTARSAEPGMRFESTELRIAGEHLAFGPPDADFFYGFRRPEDVPRPATETVFAFPPMERGALVAHLWSRDHEHLFALREARWRSLVQLRVDPATGGLAWSIAGDAGSQDERASFWPWARGNALFTCTDLFLYTFDLSREFYATQRARRPLEPGTTTPLPSSRCFGNLVGYEEGLVCVGAHGIGFWGPAR